MHSDLVAALLEASSGLTGLHSPCPETAIRGPPAVARRRQTPIVSSDLEIVPALVHVGRFIHQRVPAGDVLDPVEERAAVTLGARFLHRNTVGIVDDRGC